MGATPARWFVVLPDRDLPPGLLARLRNLAGPAVPRTVSHASGRPWLVGCGLDEDLNDCAVGDVRLAVVGTCSLAPAELAARAHRITDTPHIEPVLSDLRGSFHVLASVAGHTYVRGSFSGQRRMYRAQADGATICADRSRVLARLTDAEPDTAQLALRLTGDTVPHPLGWGALWRGVHAVQPGTALELLPGGEARTRRWWTPPTGELPLDEAAAGLRDALEQAVAVRVRPDEVVGADLSGGMDSTSLCFLAAQAGARLVTITLDAGASTNEDRLYATRAAGHLPLSEHLIFEPADVPAQFSGLDEPVDLGDEPSALVRTRVEQHYLAERMRTRGARLRLSGFGGDQVIQSQPSYVHGLLRRSPAAGLRHAAGWRARHRRPLGATVRALLDRSPYAAWLTESADLLRTPAAGDDLRWGLRPRLPAWASEQTVELCRERLLAAARDAAEPLHRERGRHSWIASAQRGGRLAGPLAHAGQLAGLPYHSPFCDDAVIAAALAARPHEAAGPWSYKPLLATAMHGLVPDTILRRTTKDHFGHEWHNGLRRNRHTLAAWAEDSRLVAAGLADEDALRRALHAPQLLIGGIAEFETTLGVEAWLRSLEHQDTPDTPDTTREKNSAPTAH
ncbi:asparagine synthase-related protein [Streptomyces sp. NPDC057682]|uniref:asparagine synthase-related protein n=1 Tax=Streptomyces sp. NPDC057682 TaxID=3346210 RepID=UPI003683A7B8